MASQYVAFLRGVNVGKTKRLSTSDVAKALAAHDARSIGAAGTFTLRAATAAAAKKLIAGKLPFETEIIVVAAKDVRALAESDPFDGAGDAAGVHRFLTVMENAPKKKPTLPVERPEGKGWQVRLVRIDAPFALSLRRNTEGKFYPNPLVEDLLEVRATTRAWSILAGIEKALAET